MGRHSGFGPDMGKMVRTSSAITLIIGFRVRK
jgi:hypothetical protein